MIELLVVITIIVVLLALLTPALDKAIYEAEMLSCAGNIDGQMTAASIYVMDNRRSYPHRPTEGSSSILYPPSRLTDPAVGHDMRTIMGPYVSTKVQLDPFCDEVTLEDTPQDDDTWIDSNYFLWYGYKFANNGGMQRLGQRVRFGGTSVNLMVSDYDFDDGATVLIANHPDDQGAMFVEKPQDTVSPVSSTQMGYPQGKYTWSRWVNVAGVRGLLDMNYGLADGSHKRVKQIERSDDRFDKVAYTAAGGARTVQVPQ